LSVLLRPQTKRAGRLLLAPALTLTLLATVLAGPASASESGDMIAKTNASRSSHGLGALAAHAELMNKAQGWANYMAAHHTLAHSNYSSGVSANWSKMGENVGKGYDTTSVHNSFMNSSPHRANILDGAYNYIGVGVAHSSDGFIYVDEIFMRAGGAVAAPAPPRVSTPRVSRSYARPRVAPAPTPAAAPAPPPPPPPPPQPTRWLIRSLTLTSGSSLG
jgi:hypothetical protein